MIRSHAGEYTVSFEPDALSRLNDRPGGAMHLIVDATVARLYAGELGTALAGPSVLIVEASEAAKSLERFPDYVNHLVARGVRRHHRLVAIGGGVIQDITSFLAAVLLRGLPWEFYPTTLLAQADSCIGSKSSINVGSAKNVLGTFTPPTAIRVATPVLATLSDADRRSGVGEMLKVHAVAGPASFDAIAADYEALLRDAGLMQRYIRRSLEIKKALVEADEFDRGVRLVMNYGHTFGHALEASTGYAIPHGIAVTIGMDMANFVAARLHLSPEAHFTRMHPVLRRNYAGLERPVDLRDFLASIGRDKKNTDRELSLILLDEHGAVRLLRHASDRAFSDACGEYLDRVLAP